MPIVEITKIEVAHNLLKVGDRWETLEQITESISINIAGSAIVKDIKTKDEGYIHITPRNDVFIGIGGKWYKGTRAGITATLQKTVKVGEMAIPIWLIFLIIGAIIAILIYLIFFRK
jgi:hypothetical protein